MNSPLALTELYTLMLQRLLNAEVLAAWVRKSYGEPAEPGNAALVDWVAQHCAPHPLDRLRVITFDRYLMHPGVQDSEFTQTMVALRNVFARNANMETSSTVTLGAPSKPVSRPRRRSTVRAC
jgi:hypothetical protein